MKNKNFRFFKRVFFHKKQRFSSLNRIAFLCCMLGWLRVFGRFFYFVFYTIIHILGFAFHILFQMPRKVAAARFRRKWLNHVPATLGFQITASGKPYNGTCLYVANHVSYLDPFVILLHTDAYVVSKAEVGSWPLIGLAGALAGTIFVKRENRESRSKTISAIQTSLEHGTSILVFPEGTTTAGNSTLSFRPRAFEVAEKTGTPVQPIAIEYDSPLAPFINDDLFLTHFFRLFRQQRITGRIVFGPLMTGTNTCAQSQEWINMQLFSSEPEMAL